MFNVEEKVGFNKSTHLRLKLSSAVDTGSFCWTSKALFLLKQTG
jgi:hypothetical protein